MAGQDDSPMLVFSPLETGVLAKVSGVCIGTGRFLRAVLVPALSELGGEVVLAQTRGTSFGKYLAGRPSRTYEVDTVLQDGKVLTGCFQVAASGSLGSSQGREAFMTLPAKLPGLRYIGLGLTEAGITHNGRSILDLAEFLHECFLAGLGRETPLSVINTDNMPFNGDAVQSHVSSCDFTQQCPQLEAFEKWLQSRVCFHNTMVDRITSHRAGAPEVPRAEPLPAKALVLEDLNGLLPHQWGGIPGVLVRTEPGQLALDIALKLRIANGLHTAMVYAMGLGRLFRTDLCIGHPSILPYLEQLFERDIVHSCAELSMPRLKATPVLIEWLSRLQHPHFGLECFFVTQNATQKLGIRLLPSVLATLKAGETPSSFMAFAFAVTLRFLTPIGDQPRLSEHPPVFSGRLDAADVDATAGLKDSTDRDYTPGLAIRPGSCAYEFRDADGLVPFILSPLGRKGGCSLKAAVSLTGEVLSRHEGFNAHSVAEHKQFAYDVGTLLHRLLSGEGALQLLAELRPQQPLYLEERNLEEAVKQEVEACEAIDVHTHLFPASHGAPLTQFGIDAMLTYHYLVAEYLASSRESAEEFYNLSRNVQAERVWQGLFVEASPLSEQCRGVLTTLAALGLHDEVASRDLEKIRRWYAGQDADMFNEKMMRLARLRYVVTSHDPFEPQETNSCLREPPPQPPRYRRALSLDKLLEGNWELVRQFCKQVSLRFNLASLATVLEQCIEKLQPVLLTAATPSNFIYEATDVATPETPQSKLEELINIADPPSSQLVLEAIVLPLCRKSGLPLSLRMGTRRAVNPSLRLGGDGVGLAQLESLESLCCTHPSNKFMATALSPMDQHQLAVLAGRFRNLHIWGCWWYCNYPSIVADVTATRLEMLGTSFTFQTSSARVHDQLIYKWIHARALLARLLTAKYVELHSTSWRVSRGDIRRDVRRLLGGAYEEFLSVSLNKP